MLLLIAHVTLWNRKIHCVLCSDAVISQPKASSKDISLAWERIEAFLKVHLGSSTPAVLATKPAVSYATAQSNSTQSDTQTA